MLLHRHPVWMTLHGQGSSSQFFVVQERAIPGAASFWTDNMRHRIFERGQFPWERIIDDLPHPRFFGEQGHLDTRAAWCEVIEETTVTTEAVPVALEEYEEHLVPDERTGGTAVNLEVRGLPRTIGQPKLLAPEEGHRIVKVAWCSSVRMTLRRERLIRAHFERYGDRAWSYTPIFEEPHAVVRYVLAFWHIPAATLHVGML